MRKLCFVVLAVFACDPPPADNAQNPTPNGQYPTATAATGTAAPTATARPTATVAATATPTAVATATPTATPTATATNPPPTPTALLPNIPLTIPGFPTGFPAFPTFSMPPGLQLPNPTQLAQALPAIPLDASVLNQIKTAGEQLMNQGMAALGDPADVGIKAAAVRYAPLMIPEGAAYKDSLPAGGHKAFDVTLAGNKCYTIIAYSPPNNVADVDLHLLVPPFYNMDAGHDDATNGTAVIGKAPAPICPFTLIPIPYRVDVSAKSGQGQVIVQVYSKNK